MDPITARTLDLQLDHLRTRRDTFADRLIVGAGAGTADRLTFRQVLGTVLESEPVKDFVEDEGEAAALDQLISPDLVRHAQGFFATNGPAVMTVLVASSLPECYAAGRGAQALYLTGELVSHPARRVRETAQMVLDMLAPDPNIRPADRGRTTTLHAGQRGARIARRIRVIHALNRKLLDDVAGERWQSRAEALGRRRGPALGEPINAEDLAGTLLTFTVTVMEGLPLLGVWPKAKDTEAWFHVWDVIGRHLGVGVESSFDGSPSPYVPRSSPAAESVASGSHVELSDSFGLWSELTPEIGGLVLDAIRRRHRTPTYEGKVLTNALLRELQRPLPRLWKPLPAAFVRYLAGDDVGDLLGVREGRLDHWLGQIRSNRRVAKSLDRGLGRPARLVGGELAAGLSVSLLQSFLDDAPAPTSGRRAGVRGFEVPESLCRAWGLDGPTGGAKEVPLSLQTA